MSILVYKAEVQSHGPNNSNISKNDKTVYVGSTQNIFLNITIIVVLHTKYIETEVVYLICEKLRRI